MTRYLDTTYRPKTFEEVIGQESAVKLLQGKKYKSYVLHGHSGSGKTTLSRIFANQGGAEVIEIDASDGGVDLVRSLKDMAMHPSLLGNSRVIIIDEAHDLNEKSWNALLKVIEDAPTDTTWMLCTTKLHKVPDTIQNRSRLVRFGRIKKKDIISQLQYIASNENVEVAQEVIEDISSYADGSMRQAIKSLNTYIDTGELDLPATDKAIIDLLRNIYSKETAVVSQKTRDMDNNDIYMLCRVMSEYMTFINVVSSKAKSEEWTQEVLLEYTNLSPQLKDDLRELTSDILATIPAEVNGNPTDLITKRVYQLFDLVMKHYNHFSDNTYNVNSSILAYMVSL